jgi:hypothetical protein
MCVCVCVCVCVLNFWVYWELHIYIYDISRLRVKVPVAYKLSKYFAKYDDRCILCNEIVHTTVGSTSQEDHDVQIVVGTRVEPPQIPGHTNYARSVRQQFPSNTGLRFSREIAVLRFI